MINKLFVAILVLLAGFAEYCSAATRYGDILIQITSATSGESSFGYMDFQVTVSNSGTEAHTVKLFFSKENFGHYDNFISGLSREVTVPAGTSASVSLFQPALYMPSNMIAVSIDGNYQRDVMSIPANLHCENYYSRGGNTRYCVMLSRKTSFDKVNNAMEEFIESTRDPFHSGRDTYGLAISSSNISDWSENWLSYSRYSSIIMMSSEWQELPESIEKALLEYVRCGGCVTVIGQIEGLDENVFCLGKTLRGIFEIRYLGFGEFITTDQTDISNWTLENWRDLTNSWSRTSLSISGSNIIQYANEWFPVVDNLSIPIRGLLVIMLIFAVTIGPVNIFILGRKKRQILLFVTVPLFSLIASVIIFGYATFSEGWSGYCRTQSLTILDENENLASTVGIAAFYCPVTPSDGLHFDYETECSVVQGYNSYAVVRGGEIDWTNEQHFSSGWITSRVPLHFMLRKSQMRREKVVFSENGSDNCQALNGLGAAVDSLYYADAAGNVYYATDIPAGQKATMQLMENAKPLWLSTSADTSGSEIIREIYSSDWHQAIDEMVKSPDRYLCKNCYIAIVKEPLFVERALRKNKSEIVESVIFGIAQEDSDAG